MSALLTIQAPLPPDYWVAGGDLDRLSMPQFLSSVNYLLQAEQPKFDFRQEHGSSLSPLRTCSSGQHMRSLLTDWPRVFLTTAWTWSFNWTRLCRDLSQSLGHPFEVSFMDHRKIAFFYRNLKKFVELQMFWAYIVEWKDSYKRWSGKDLETPSRHLL